MTKKQPKALELAEELEQMFEETPPECEEAAQELRRLYQAHSRQARRLQQKEQQIQDIKRSRDFHRKETSNRLYTENQELNHKLTDYASTVEHLLRCSHDDGAEILRLREENERLEALNQKLQEACKRFIGSLGVMIGDPDSDGDILFARKVLKESEGETK